VVIVLKDITEFKKLEQVKSQFVSMVAHELKAPVAASIGFIDILRKPELRGSPEQQSDFLSRTHSRLKSLVLMINDLLDISRMELHKVVREIQDVVVEDAIAEAAHLLKLEAEKKRVTLSIPSSETTHTIRIDPSELQRLITNLMSNAIKYNKEGGSVSVEVADDGLYTKVRVADTGIGLRPEEKQKLFGEFFRAKNEFTKNIHGTGLGLSIVRRIVEAYAGKVECESEYGIGSSFTLSFPNNEIINK
jgi:signal transduction histidine kinase